MSKQELLKENQDMKFSFLTFVKRTEKKRGTQRISEFECDCGSKVFRVFNHVKHSHLRGHTPSCGCHRVWHGLCKTPEYYSWIDMRGRCNNQKSDVYHYYGGRGIKVCERWDDFRNFLSDMGKRPTLKHSIDRIDVNGNYEPSNCRWADKVTQSINTRKRLDNTSGIRGVSWCKRNKKWRAFIGTKNGCVFGKRRTLKEDAIKDRKEFEIIYHNPVINKTQPLDDTYAGNTMAEK